MRTRRPAKDYWPSWRYGPDGKGEVFLREADVPYGWTKKPGEVFVPKAGTEALDRAALEQELRDQGIEPIGHWSARYMKELLK